MLSFFLKIKKKEEFYFVSIDSQAASSSSAHLSSSKLIKFGADASSDFVAIDDFVLCIFFEDFDRVGIVSAFELDSSFNHDSKLRSRSGFEMSLSDCDC